MARRFAPSLLLAACAALATPARAGAPFPFFGVHVVQADLTACDAISVDGAITLNANVPDDLHVYTWRWSSEARDGTNVASVGDGPFALAPTAGDTLLENTGSLLVGPSAPGALATPFDFAYTASTYADGVLILRSTLTARCEGGEPVGTAIETRLAPPECGPRLPACQTVLLPKGTLRISDGGDRPERSKLSFTASRGAADLEHFQDPTLSLAEGGATTATCIYDATDTLVFGVGADAGLLDDRSAPMWKRKATPTRVANRYRDPPGARGAVRSLSQTSGAKAKVALSARGMPVDVASFTEEALLVQQRTVNPRDRIFTCTEVLFLGGEIAVDAAKGTVKAKIKIPACGPECL